MQKNVKKRIVVPLASVGKRLDQFVKERAGNFSRSWVQKLIREGDVLVNGKLSSPSRKLKRGDIVVVKPKLPPKISLEGEKSLDRSIGVVFENSEIIVINKPSGVVVHPSLQTPSGTLVNWLLAHYPNIREVGENDLRPGIVHRLDKETSGLLVVAKTNSSYTWLKKLFKLRRVHKRYWALVHGSPEGEQGNIYYPIGRSKKDPTKQQAYKSKGKIFSNARDAETHWRVVKRYAGFSLLELTPVTGRMHQLRVHLAAIGHPIAGDKKYASSSLKALKNLSRMFLHSNSLSFELPSGEKFSFVAPLPQNLEEVLKNLPFMLK